MALLSQGGAESQTAAAIAAGGRSDNSQVRLSWIKIYSAWNMTGSAQLEQGMDAGARRIQLGFWRWNARYGGNIGLLLVDSE